MKTWKWALSLAMGSALLIGLCSGCGSSNDVIPLADVPDPPKLPQADEGAAKPPSGSSPAVLPQG